MKLFWCFSMNFDINLFPNQAGQAPLALLDVENAITSFSGNKDMRTKVHHNQPPYRSLKVLTIQVRDYIFTKSIKKNPLRLQ